MKEEWLFRGALVPIDAATTAALVAEIKRLIDVVGGLVLAQPEQEPVAYFDWLPEGATHLGQLTVNVKSGGALKMRTYAFKYEDGVLMVYTTDNDNEYPGWREAKQCFYHLNFPVFPIPTAPPKQEPRNFCPRCGKRLIGMAFAAGGVHTCTPPEGGHQ